MAKVHEQEIKEETDPTIIKKHFEGLEIKVKTDPTIIEEHFEELQQRKKLLSEDYSDQSKDQVEYLTPTFNLIKEEFFDPFCDQIEDQIFNEPSKIKDELATNI